MFYCFRCLFVGIRPQDHHNEHRLDQAVTMVVLISSVKFCGEEIEDIEDIENIEPTAPPRRWVFGQCAKKRAVGGNDDGGGKRPWGSATAAGKSSRTGLAIFGGYLMEFDLRTIISAASLVRVLWWYPFVERSSGAKVISILRF